MTTMDLVAGFAPASIVVDVAGSVAGLAALGVLAVLGAGALRRRGSSETSSVDHYRRTLSTLEDIRSRPTPSVRILNRDDEADRPAGGHQSHVGTVPGVGARPDGDAPVNEVRAHGPQRVIASSGAHTRGSTPAPSGTGRFVFADDTPAPLPLSGDRSRSRGRAMSAMNRRPRRLVAPLAVVVAVVVILGVVVFLGDRSHQPPAAHHSTATTVPTSAGANTSSPAHHGGGGHKATTTTTSTTTTTAPSDYMPTQASATTATYVPSATHYTLGLGATTGPCWICVTNTAGATEFAQTLQAGTNHQLALTGNQDVTIGAPGAVTVTIDGKPAVLPEGDQAPFTMVLAPAGAAAATPSSTSTGCG